MARYCNGSTTYLTLADDAALSLTPPYTLAMWLKISQVANTGYPKILSWNASLATPSLNMYMAGNATANPDRLIVRLEGADGDYVKMDDIYNIGENADWQHILITVSAEGVVNVYVDGDLKGTETNASLGTINYAGPLYIGQYATPVEASNFHGDMAELAKWDAVLTSGELAQLVDGENPEAIQNANLAWCVHMLEGYSESIEGITVTNNGTTDSDHPDQMYAPGKRRRYARHHQVV